MKCDGNYLSEFGTHVYNIKISINMSTSVISFR